MRVKAILRRATSDGPSDATLRFADVELDPDAHTVRRAGVVDISGIDLTDATPTTSTARSGKTSPTSDENRRTTAPAEPPQR